MTGNKAFVALAVATALGVLGAATAAASDHDRDRDRERGGFVIPGSTDGVNPAMHPEYFGSPPNYACFERFNTYDWASGTYVGSDGRRHPCRIR
jgi:hypothetical protein